MKIRMEKIKRTTNNELNEEFVPHHEARTFILKLELVYWITHILLKAKIFRM